MKAEGACLAPFTGACLLASAQARSSTDAATAQIAAWEYLSARIVPIFYATMLTKTFQDFRNVILQCNITILSVIQMLNGSFSAVSKPIFANKYPLENS